MGARRNRWALIAIAPVVLGAPAAAHAACTPANNVEAIVDDSGSMFATDSNRLRVQAMDLLINALDAKTIVGAVEFGGQFVPDDPPPADTVFAPQPVGGNAATMKSALDTKIQADNGGTDYNAAFAQSDADNPNADARIFLTDGGHDIGDYANGHLVHKVPTYVVSFGSGISTDDAARLQLIANDTGGAYFPLADSNSLQSTLDTIESALSCETAPAAFTDQLAAGKSAVHKLAIPKHVTSARIALTWSSPLDTFTISGIKIVRGKRTVAVAARKLHKLKLKRVTSPTFLLVRVSKLVRGTLTFKVKATTVGSGQPKATLTTQVTRHR